jgi:hypothetical protein
MRNEKNYKIYEFWQSTLILAFIIIVVVVVYFNIFIFLNEAFNLTINKQQK